MEAILETYRRLSPRLQARPTGSETIRRLRKGAIKTLGLRDDDDAISEDTVRHHVKELRPVFRLVREGIIPLGRRPAKQELSEQTRLEMEAGRRAFAKHASGRSKKPSSATHPAEKYKYILEIS